VWRASCSTGVYLGGLCAFAHEKIRLFFGVGKFECDEILWLKKVLRRGGILWLAKIFQILELKIFTFVFFLIE
jgi:hypothetical protein